MRISAAGTEIAPTLPASRGSLPPEGAAAPAAWQSQFRGPCWGGSVAPTLAAAPAGWQSRLHSSNWSQAGTSTLLILRIRQTGFTLIELLIVVAIMAIATAGVGLALRDSSGTALEREAQRLAVLLDSARVQSRMTANPVRWRPTPSGFAFEGLATGSTFPATWLGQDVRVAGNTAVVLGPEPVIGPQQIRLVSISQPARSLILATDGIRPFAVVMDGAP